MTLSQPQPTSDPASSRTIRHDGLTPERQEVFLETLAATGNVSEAAAAARISRTALYRLRKSPESAAFQARWSEALQEAVAALADAAFSRALNGTSEPVWYKGEQIGERVRHDNKLLMFLLRSHDPATYARPQEPRAAQAGTRRDTMAQNVEPRSRRVLVSTLSTSHPESQEDLPEANLDNESFRAELRKLRSSPEIPRHLSKRNARRLAAKGRLPAAHPT